jgi:hypothetical protein
MQENVAFGKEVECEERKKETVLGAVHARSTGYKGRVGDESEAVGAGPGRGVRSKCPSYSGTCQLSVACMLRFWW